MELGMVELIQRVVLSWQVIVITVGLIVYFMLVSYVTRPRSYRPPKEKSPKPEKVKVKEEEVSGDANDELGLEDETPPA
jgi:flagellar biosynthesis/type III secretory pathway M-ring protein FliF/YscJ